MLISGQSDILEQYEALNVAVMNQREELWPLTLYVERLAVIWLKAWAFWSNRCLAVPLIPDSSKKQYLNETIKSILTKLVCKCEDNM